MPAPDRIRLLLDWTLDAKHSLFVEGIERGFYASRGIELSILEPEKKSSLALEKLHRGETDLAINYPHNILLMQREFPGIVSAASLVQKNPEGLLSLESRGIQKPLDLAGKRIGVGPSPVSQAQLRLFLSGNCIPEEGVSLVTVGFEGEALLLAGEIDALDAVSYAIPRTTGKGFAVDFLSYTAQGLPDSPFLVFAARKDWLDFDPGLMRRFLAATKMGFEAVCEWKLPEWKAYVKDLPGGKTGEMEMEIWRRTCELMNPQSLFHQDPTDVEGLAAILEKGGLLAAGSDLGELFPAVDPA
jgi:ABC-type nitrate/sulfonate/bicarbonate transport system substrate-binding protein